jgi:hypothetical protein
MLEGMCHDSHKGRADDGIAMIAESEAVLQSDIDVGGEEIAEDRDG